MTIWTNLIGKKNIKFLRRSFLSDNNESSKQLNKINWGHDSWKRLFQNQHHLTKLKNVERTRLENLSINFCIKVHYSRCHRSLYWRCFQTLNHLVTCSILREQIWFLYYFVVSYQARIYNPVKLWYEKDSWSKGRGFDSRQVLGIFASLSHLSVHSVCAQNYLSVNYRAHVPWSSLSHHRCHWPS